MNTNFLNQVLQLSLVYAFSTVKEKRNNKRLKMRKYCYQSREGEKGSMWKTIQWVWYVLEQS